MWASSIWWTIFSGLGFSSHMILPKSTSKLDIDFIGGKSCNQIAYVDLWVSLQQAASDPTSKSRMAGEGN